MNRFCLLFATIALAGLGGCDRGPEAPTPEEAQAHALAHTEPGYVCPMHPQVTDDEPGSCPVCGMDLVQRQREPAAGNAQDHALAHAEPGYVCPMHPQVTADEPGSCPVCGMDLVPRKRDRPSDKRTTVRIDPDVRNSLGVRVAPVIREPLPRAIDAVGQVVYDESRVRHIHARAEGWAQRVYVSSVGDRVEKGQPLVELFSPLLESAQEEFLQALRMGGDALVTASENRLRALGIDRAEIQRLRKDRRVDGYIVFRSDMNGVITRLDVREGMFVRPDTDMVVMADLERIWIEADVLTRQSSWLAPGLPATVTLDQSDDPALRGELSYVYPEADPVTRAVRVRLSFANPDGRLKPNSFATVRIVERDAAPVLQIPREALIRTSREDRVIIDTGGNRFVPRAVTVAYESGEMAAISTGLAAGEQVVTSGQFMLDSEASLRSELDRVSSGDAAASGDTHQH